MKVFIKNKNKDYNLGVRNKMLSIMLIFILVVYFGTISLKSKKYNSEKRTDRVTKPLSIIMAITLTPLDQYVNMIYSYMNWISIFLGLMLYVTFYIVTFAVEKRN